MLPEEFFGQGKPELIITDVDGTLLNKKHELTKYTMDVLKEVKNEHQIPIVFATGKTFYSTQEPRKELKYDQDERYIGINLNGLLIHDYLGNIIQEEYLQIQSSLICLRACWEKNIAIVAYSANTCVAREESSLTTLLVDYHEPKTIIDSNFEENVSNGTIHCHKLLMHITSKGEHPSLRIATLKFRDELERIIDVKKYGVEFTMAVDGLLEFMPAGWNKARAIKQVCEMMKVNVNRVVAFGDGDNDKEMLSSVGFGCAMANGSIAAKESANLTIGSNEEDGMARFLSKYILNK